MEDDKKAPLLNEGKANESPGKEVEEKGGGDSGAKQPPTPSPRSGGWGGWGFSAFSVLSDLQKAATSAAEEISRNAAVVAEKAAKGIADMQVAEDSDSSKEDREDQSVPEKESEDEDEKLRKSTLDKLENASEDSFLGQGLKVIDNSVENFASGAWQALGNALKGGTKFVQKLEDSAVNLADSIQQGGLPAGSVAPSLIETGRAFTSKGMQVLEFVGKETMDLLIADTGLDVERKSKDSDDQLYEEVTFDRCFYIYGGPEVLEELEALSNHYALLFNRRKVKLPSEEKSLYESKLKEIQQIFGLSGEMNSGTMETDKGKKKETATERSGDEVKTLHDSSISKAADMAAGFTSALTGLVVDDIVQRTVGRIESLHSEGIHRLSEMCCVAVSQLLVLGKSIISSANKTNYEDAGEDMINIDWPEDSVEKAKIMRTKAQLMTGYVEAVASSFITGISDVAEAYLAAMKAATADSHENVPQTAVQENAKAFSEHIRSDQTMAVGKIQDGLQYLSYVVLSTSIPAA